MPEAAPTPTNAPAVGAWQDPYRAYNFKIEIQGVAQGHFTECSQIGVRVEALSYREAGMQQVVHRMPGRVEYADVTLRYGVTSSRELWDWFMTAATGNPERKNVSIVLLDSTGTTEVMRWNLQRAWARAATTTAYQAGGQEIAIDSVTLVFEGLERN